jgi:quercetin dioxygenase-like cupin family protein
MHSHPYTQVRFINEGEADVWTEGGGSAKPRLKVGSTVALLPNLTHSFADANNQSVF